jgi:hypothetical protein
MTARCDRHHELPPLLMSAREVRMARNEVASRELNEEIEEAYEGAPRSNR